MLRLPTNDTLGTKELKARCYLDTPGKPVWTVRQSDKQVHNNTYPVDVRTLREVVVSEDIELFMEMLGFKYVSPSRMRRAKSALTQIFTIFTSRFHHEYLKVGTRATAKLEKSRAEILITKAKRLQERGNISSGIEIDAGRYLVEITSASLEKDIATFAQELHSFGTQLYPYVHCKTTCVVHIFSNPL